MLLTDGDPNVYPPAGFIPSFQKYKLKKNHHPTLNTFALGKRIDSVLLDSYAKEGNGSYTFIPCPGFVGTIFVNSLANSLSVMGSNTQLTLEPLNGAKIEHIYGGYKTDNNVTQCGELRFGQYKDMIVKFKLTDEQKV